MNYRLTELKVLLFLLLLSAVSCQRPMYDEEDDEDGVSQTNLPLKISARSSGESQINYPAYIYAFAEDGSCSASLKMTDNAQIEMKLPPARYTIVAIAGLGEEYIVPKDPSLDDVIVMKENNRSSRALMMGTSTVTIANKKNISVSVTLYYAVSLVNISLEDIPANVKKVSLQISPLYSSLSFTREYSGKDKSTEIICESEPGGIWSAKPFYIFPGSGSQTVFSITLEDNSQTKTFGYTFKGKPEANVPLNIGGSYSGDVTVGGSLIEQIRCQQQKLMQERGLKLKVVGIADGHHALFTRAGVDLSHYKEELAEKGMPSSTQVLHDEIIGMNIFNSVFVDCTASAEVASLYKDFLMNNISVVAANKIAASSEYSVYSELKQIARRRGVKFLFETNVGAGLPIINTINDLINSGDKILKIEAVLSGTLNYIFNKISADIPFSKTIKMAQEERYSEPDPRIDLSGKDVIRKLVILAREAGYKLEQEDVEKHLFVPNDFFEGPLEEFWKKVPSLDADFESRRQKLEDENKRWRFVAKLEDGKGSVSLQEVDSKHPFYGLEGSNNIILLTTERYKEYPMMIQGYGAGASVTAAGVFADIMSIANI